MITYAIDFGTSNSLLAAVIDGKIHPPMDLDPSAQDASVLRSILYFENKDTCYYGQEAVNQYVEHSGDGRLLRSMKKYLPSPNYRGTFIEDRVLKIEEMVGLFLLEMKKRADRSYGQTATSLVLGRPARFSHRDEEEKLAQYRLEKAATFAGFKNIEYVAEPLAAAFDLRSQLKETKTILVVDLGGGTSDFTVIEVGPMPYRPEHVLALGGLSVAGDMIDGRFMKQQIAPFFGSEAQYRMPMSQNTLQMPPVLKSALSSPADIVQLEHRDIFQFFKEVEKLVTTDEDKKNLHRLMVLVEDQLGFRIYEEVDRCKRQLGEQESTHFLFQYPEIEVEKPVERQQYQADTQVEIDKIMQTLQETLAQAQLKPSEVDLVHCTGGTSKLFSIREQLLKIFDASQLKTSREFHSVTQGLAERAKELQV